jgi:hypothetical protein
MICKMLYCNLYVLTLVDKSIFLYPGNLETKGSDAIKCEFSAFYPDYPAINDITMVIHNMKVREIDGMVLHYMHKYGLDKVRGGSYTQCVFSNELQTFISDRIKYIYYDLPQMHSIATNNLHNISAVVQLQSRINAMMPVMSAADIETLSGLKPCCPATPLYNNLVNKCADLYFQFRKQCPDGLDDLQKVLGFRSNIWLYSPHVAFDSYFINGIDKELADRVLYCIDFMRTYMCNRVDELEYDMRSMTQPAQLDLQGLATGAL